MEAPDTRPDTTPEEADSIRQKVCALGHASDAPGAQMPAQPEDAPALFELLQDTRVNGPLYTIPKPVTLAWVAKWIDDHTQEQARGEGVLLITREGDTITGFSDIQFWPQYAAAEMGGAIKPGQQSQGRGGAGAGRLFDWLFDEMGIKLLAMTSATDNIRTQKLLTHLGFTQGRDRLSQGPDGSTRPSLYWELLKENRVRF